MKKKCFWDILKFHNATDEKNLKGCLREEKKQLTYIVSKKSRAKFQNTFHKTVISMGSYILLIY